MNPITDLIKESDTSKVQKIFFPNTCIFCTRGDIEMEDTRLWTCALKGSSIRGVIHRDCFDRLLEMDTDVEVNMDEDSEMKEA